MAPAKLREWREKTGLSLSEAAARVNAELSTHGITAATSAAAWHDWEAGKKLPRAHNMEALEVITERSVTCHDWAEFERSRIRSAAAGHN